MFAFCEKTDDGEYVPPITIYEKLNGTWELTSVLLVDEIAVANSMSPSEVELKTKFNFSTFGIVFNTSNSEPSTFEVTGTSPELFLKSGYWDLDQPYVRSDNNPSKIYLYTDEEKSSTIDSLTLVSIPGAKAELAFSLIRSVNGTPYVSYQYLLKQSN